MSFSRRTLSITTIVVILALLGGGIWWRLRPEPTGDDETTAQAEEDSPITVEGSSTQFSTDIPQAVSGAQVVQDTLWISVTAEGRAAANREVVLNSRTEGVIQSLPVSEDQTVQEGQLLLQVDTMELVLERSAAMADLVDAQARFRAETLFDDSISDPQIREQRLQVIRSRSGLNAAEVRLQRAELALRQATVRAPFGGRIGDLQVFQSQYVTPGTELMKLVDIDPIKIEVSVLEREIGMLSRGRRARVRVTAFPDEEFIGRIESINPIVDPENRTGRVTVVLSNPGGRIKPGMHADVRLDAESFPNRIMVPASSVLQRGEALGRLIVFRFRPDSGGNEDPSETGTAEWVYVDVGEENESFIEIVPTEENPGVRAGDWVLTGSHHYLAHDTKVRLVDNPALAGGRPGA